MKILWNQWYKFPTLNVKLNIEIHEIERFDLNTGPIFPENIMFEVLFSQLPTFCCYKLEQQRNVVENYWRTLLSIDHATTEKMLLCGLLNRYKENKNFLYNCFEIEGSNYGFPKDALPICQRVVYDRENTYFNVLNINGNPQINAFVNPELFIYQFRQQNYDQSSHQLMCAETIYEFQKCYSNAQTRITITTPEMLDDSYSFSVYVSTNQSKVKTLLNINGSLSSQVLQSVFLELNSKLMHDNIGQCLDKGQKFITTMIQEYFRSKGFEVTYTYQATYRRSLDQFEQIIPQLHRELFISAIKAGQFTTNMSNTTESSVYYTKLQDCIMKYLILR